MPLAFSITEVFLEQPLERRRAIGHPDLLCKTIAVIVRLGTESNGAPSSLASGFEDLDRVALQRLDDRFSYLHENERLPDGVDARGNCRLDAGSLEDAPVEHIGT